MKDPVFEVRDAVFHYADVPALDGVSFSIAPRQRVAVLGANGSGKSTLLRLLNGLCFVEKGGIFFEGRELTEDALSEEQFSRHFRQTVAFVFQNPDVQLFNPTVFDEIAFGPLQLGKSNIAELVNQTLDRFQLSHLKDRAPHRLSGGEKKRVSLASALVLDPAVLILDEPTAALDPESQSAIIEFLLDSRGARTVITATHNLEILEEIADHCLVLQAGKLVAEGAPEQILRDAGLLRETRLLHSHRHRHGGILHSHPHVHPHHEHGRELR